MYRCISKYFFFIAVLFVTSTSSQTTRLDDSVEEKILIVTARTESEFLKGLTEKDFEVYDGKNLQRITSFGMDMDPMSIGILVDLSGSMGAYDPGISTSPFQRRVINRVPWIVEGLTKFVNQNHPTTEYCIISFAKEQSTLLDWSSDKKQIQKVIQAFSDVIPKGNTILFDSLTSGIERVSDGRNNKKVVIVISDGMDNNSKKSDFEDVKRLLKQKDVVVYFVNLLPDKAMLSSYVQEKADGIFQALTKLSGGSVYYAQKQEDADLIFTLISMELSHQYKIGFKPTINSSKDSWHEVKIRLAESTKRKFKKVRLKTRTGFYL